MSDYIHHLPGRLRVKTRAVKDHAENARTVRERVARMPGVQVVETNLLTGSVLVHYDAARVQAQQILEEVRSLGLAPHASLPQAPSTAGTAEWVAQRIATRLAETVLERSALALLGALI